MRRRALVQARAGSIRSPIWVGGGARSPRARATSRRRSIARCTAPACVPCWASWCAPIASWSPRSSRVAEPRTKLLVEKLKALSLGNALIVIEAQDDKLMLAARNLPNVDVITVAGINPVALAAHDKVLMTVGAVKMIEERLQ